MSNEEVPTLLLRRCRERSCIRLKKEYLQEWKERRSTPITNIEAAYNELIVDFKKTDISKTSEPVITQNNDQLLNSFPPDQYYQGVVLQIQDTWDISHSIFSQLNNLKNGLEIPRGMLRWTLSDGTTLVQAREIEDIQGINLMTPFGTKLLVKSCQVRRGMLHLSNQNTTVLGGGGVSELYGGDMIKELQKRMTEQLDATTEPNSPMPTNTTSSRPSTNNFFNTSSSATSTTSHTNINHTNNNHTRSYTNTNTQNNASHTDPRVAAELNDLNNMDMSQFDDTDMDYFDDDKNMDQQFNDTFQNTMDDDPMDGIDDDSYFEDDHVEFNDNDFQPVRPTPIPSSAPVNNDSDDDFAPIQSAPVKSRLLVQKSPKTKERSASITESSTQKTILNTFSNLLSKRSQTAEATTSSTKRFKDKQAEEELLPVKEEKKAVVDSVHWIDPSTWLEEDDEEEEIEGVEIKPDGTTHVTFEALHRILDQMEKNTFTASIADAIIVRAKFIKMAKMRFSALTGFYALFDIGDPLEKSKETIRILIGNKLFMELLNLDPNNIKEFGEAIKDQKKARKILVPFDKRMRAKQLEVQLNVNIMEKELSDDGEGQHFVPPTISLKMLSTT